MGGVSDFPKPLIALVNGPAIGWGFTMTMHCDFVLLAQNAFLSTPFVQIGIVPECLSSYTVPARIGYARVRRTLFAFTLTYVSLVITYSEIITRILKK